MSLLITYATQYNHNASFRMGLQRKGEVRDYVHDSEYVGRVYRCKQPARLAESNARTTFYLHCAAGLTVSGNAWGCTYLPIL